MKINFSKNKIDKFLINRVETVFNETIKLLNIPCKDLEVNIAVVNSLKIKKMNKLYRGVNKVTDILSFPFLLQPNVSGMQLIENELKKENFLMFINPETNNVVLGDLYVCFRKMKQQAKEYGTGIEREFTYLCLHGLLHLLGYDHLTDEDKKVMREKEEYILKNVFEKQYKFCYN